MTPTVKPQLWFLTGSQALYGEETLEQVAGQSLRIQQLLAAAGGLPAEIVGKPVLTEGASIRRVLQEANADAACVGVIAWMHTFSPGEDVDHRAGRAAQAAAAPAHPAQRGAARGPPSTWTS